MNRLEHLLTIVGEEGVEVAHRASKASRFGLMEVQPGQSFTNAERLMGEFHDLLAVLEMLHAQAGLRLHIDRATIDAKKGKVEALLAYSRELGTLQP